jgi:2-polyprenyl-6-methoxyphenol hydroxylase-like FAD-dependent oxidoreductase
MPVVAGGNHFYRFDAPQSCVTFLRMTVLISGIGIAGPTLAYWLSVYGIESVLVERAPQLRTGGYIIDFWGSGFDVAERMGLLADIRREGYDVQELRLVNARGRRVGGFDVDIFRTAAQGRYVSIPRSALAGIIYRKIEGRCETIFGDSITEIQQTTDGVQVAFEHAAPRRFDAVVGADGLHSVVRKLTFGNEDQFEKFLGYSVAAFEAVGYRPGGEDKFISYSVPGRQVGRFTMRNNRTLFLFVFADDRRVDAGDGPAQKKILRSHFGGLGWECPQILAALEACDDLYFDRVSQIRMDTWSKGRVGLIGDAAACPSLLAGQGSALAMLAAYVLAGELGRANSTVAEAFQRYERFLHAFISGKQVAAEKFAGSFAPKTRLGLFLRNQATKMFALPFISRRVMKSTLIDRIELPSYS